VASAAAEGPAGVFALMDAQMRLLLSPKAMASKSGDTGTVDLATAKQSSRSGSVPSMSKK